MWVHVRASDAAPAATLECLVQHDVLLVAHYIMA